MSAYAVLPLTTGGETLIDLADLEWASGFAWRKSKSAKGPQYAVRSSKGRTYFLHRELLDVRPGLVVDHINRDPLDNRRANLRICSVAENNRNMPRLIRSSPARKRERA